MARTRFDGSLIRAGRQCRVVTHTIRLFDRIAGDSP